MKRLIILCVSFTALCCTAFGQQPKEKTAIRLNGVVVAKYRELVHACYHMCSVTLLVKLDKPSASRFVIINVDYMDYRSLPQNRKPVPLVEKASRWEFMGVLDDGKT